MPEWVCDINDHELLGELRGLLAKVDFIYERAASGGVRVRFLVARTHSPSLKVEIFANEHPPPHFRVKYGSETANYRISDCHKLNGGLDRYDSVIRHWHSKNKPTLIDYWNKLRPSNCPVGQYVEP
jgi:type I restriction enzyme, R subunit